MSQNTGPISTALANRYKIVSHLGEGGMATVYLAEDLEHERKVAVKVLRSELAAVIGADRFLHEIKLTAALQHPNILALCLAALLLWSAAACGGQGVDRVPATEQSAEGPIDSAGENAMPDSAIITAQEELTPTVMALSGVTGTAVGLCGDAVCIKVYLASSDTAVTAQIPATYRGFVVDVEVSGEFRARGTGN